jgi:hypothetical protein
MDKKVGGVNKKHEKSFFGGIEIESIEDLTILTENAEGKGFNNKGIDWEIWRQILCIKLPKDSKENVLVSGVCWNVTLVPLQVVNSVTPERLSPSPRPALSHPNIQSIIAEIIFPIGIMVMSAKF